MSKTDKQLNKIAFILSILLASFEGESHAQTPTQCVTVKECLVGVCVPLYGACIGKLGESAPVPISSIQSCVDILTNCFASNSPYNAACKPTTCPAAFTAPSGS